MPDLVSIASPLERLLVTDNAVSDEARTVRRNATELLDAYERSEALFGPKLSLISQLRALADECSQPDWDGYGAVPLDRLSVIHAERFLRVLPTNIPLPEISAEPDGSVSLDWIHSKNRLFSLSIGPSLRIAFAWLDGSEKGHGVVRFDGANVPLRIIHGIQAVLQYQ